MRYFSQIFNSVNTVGQALLDDLAVAVRAQGRQSAVRRSQGSSQSNSNPFSSKAVASFIGLAGVAAPTGYR